jgi:hypothetical protein
MYIVELIDEGVSALTASTPRSRDIPVDKNIWHRHLGHVGKTGLDVIILGDHVEGMSVTAGDDSGMCEDCLSGKQAHRPFNGVHEPETEAGEREYLDMWGPAQLTRVGGVQYIFHIMDGYIGGPKVEFLQHKSADDSLDVFVRYEMEFERQTGKKLKIVKVENRGG